ncbi:23S rRNA pseudouridine955/2504/2580 synthase [Fibrobacter sp. UWCM]|uniref:RluA family pseudouridine synthase n=1 Tax=Fibrobacter sp. UWCM TaxID=1896208 RepID=UPI000916C1E3|nr:RluA family pseudouridine synthase [Fibrobacter sp. UWCM]SHG93165.1 23S rRNA pseudouridine955/2504/2580 synthase [Fibrobacter sp. UWCM]
MITRIIDRNFANMRLDRFLRKAFPDESLSVFFAVIRKKKVRVNGVVGKANQMLQEGDTVCIYENFKSVEADNKTHADTLAASLLRCDEGNAAQAQGDSKQATPSKSGFAKNKSTWGTTDERRKTKDERISWGAKDLDIVIQTEDYVIVNKPSGLASQPGSGTRPGESLVEYLWEWGRREGLDFKPTIAHRLDQETSGMLIAALHGDTLRDFTRMIREHEVEKFYFALVKGNLKKEKGTISESLTRTDAAKGSKMKVGESGKDAKEAVTHYRVKQHYKGYDLVKIKLETGRMHQIRAHFASIGHPLLGDTRYGDFALNREVKKTLGLHRLFLHSCRLEFVWQGERKVFDCPLPKELQSVIDKLKPMRFRHDIADPRGARK